MKIINTLLLIIIFSPLTTFGQKMKYQKDVYPLIKEGNTEAFEKLKEYTQQDPKHSNATYWLAKYYDVFATEYVSEQAAKLALESYKSCLNNTSSLNLTVLHAHRYPDAKGVESEELYKSLKAFIHTRIKELDNFIKSTSNVASKKTIKVSSINELSEKLKINLPDEVKNLRIELIQVEYSEKTYKGKTALNGPIQIKGLDKATELIVTVGGNVDCGWLLDDYKKSEEANIQIVEIKKMNYKDFFKKYKIPNQVLFEWDEDNLKVSGEITLNRSKNVLDGKFIIHVKYDECSGDYCDVEKISGIYKQGTLLEISSECETPKMDTKILKIKYDANSVIYFLEETLMENGITYIWLQGEEIRTRNEFSTPYYDYNYYKRIGFRSSDNDLLMLESLSENSSNSKDKMINEIPNQIQGVICGLSFSGHYQLMVLTKDNTIFYLDIDVEETEEGSVILKNSTVPISFQLSGRKLSDFSAPINAPNQNRQFEFTAKNGKLISIK